MYFSVSIIKKMFKKKSRFLKQRKRNNIKRPLNMWLCPFQHPFSMYVVERVVNSNTYKRLSHDDCLVNAGRPLRNSQIILFTYSNSMYPLRIPKSKSSSNLAAP